MHTGPRHESVVRRMMKWVYRWPMRSSVWLCFHTLTSWTLISRPSVKFWLSGGCSFAKVTGKEVRKILAKSLDGHQIGYSTGISLCATHTTALSHVVFKVSRLHSSGSSVVCLSFSLSVKAVPSTFSSSPLAPRRCVR